MADKNAYFRLIEPCDVPQSIHIVKTVNGKASYGTTRLQVGKKYDFDPEDSILLNCLKTRYVQKPMSQALRNALEKANVQYEEVRCNSCGGKVTKLKYNILEVVIDGELQ